VILPVAESIGHAQAVVCFFLFLFSTRKDLPMFQSITIAGYAGSDAEMRFLQSGVPVTTFRVAVNERYGENEKTVWFRVTCWRKLAEVTAQYVTKGKPLLIMGRIDARPYTNRQGDPACSLELEANTVKFLPGGPRDEQDDNAMTEGKLATNGADPHPEDISEDIPF
jgi:single-strand DNA-binding protein